MTKSELTLDLTITFSPPMKSTTCELCLEQVTGDFYTLLVKTPVVQTKEFDKNCYEQLIAIGLKLWHELQAEQEISN